MLLENIGMAFSAIRANKMRSFLTMLGIIIGIGSVIAIVSIGDSMRAMFADLYKNVGITQSYISVHWNVDDFRMSDYFTLDDLERMKEVFGDEITYSDTGSSERTEAYAGRNKVKFSMQGIDSNYQDVQPMNIIYGRALSKGDVLERRNNVVLEDKGAIKLFGTANAVGKSFRATIYGNNSDFTVVGIYQKEQTPLEAMMMGGGEYESGFLPYTLLTYPNDIFGSLHIYVDESLDLNEFSLRARQYVARQKGRTADQIQYYSAADEMASVDSMMGGLSVAVGGIAAISLLVGGIGIMNIMLVSVTERTREIGIRKALGARTSDVLIQFLTESAILSAFGGIIGIVIGGGIVTLGAALFGVQAVVKPSVILLAVSFSAMVGVFFGIYPASKAANADPIDALRYE